MADQRWWTKRPSGWNITLSATWKPSCLIRWLLPHWCLVVVSQKLVNISGKTTNLLQRYVSFLTRGWAGGGASLCLGYHSRQFPSIVDGWWRYVWQICDQNKRQQKVSPSSGTQRPRWRPNHGFNWTHGWHWVWNRALWCHVGPTLPTYYWGCSDRYMNNIAKCLVLY